VLRVRPVVSELCVCWSADDAVTVGSGPSLTVTVPGDYSFTVPNLSVQNGSLTLTGKLLAHRHLALCHCSVSVVCCVLCAV
jgi:hypothetical protein